MPDPVTPSGVISLAFDGCADWLANSAAAQAFLNTVARPVANAADAKAAILIVGPDIAVGEPYVRPSIVIREMTQGNLVEDGYSSGVFTVALERDIDGTPTAPATYRKNRNVFYEFSNLVGAIIEDLGDSSRAGATGTAFRGGRNIQWPFIGRSRTDEAGQYGYCQAVLMLPWGFAAGGG